MHVYANEIILSRLAFPIAFPTEESSLRLACVSFILKYKRKKLFEKVSLRRVRGASRPMRRFLFARSSSGQICNAICARACTRTRHSEQRVCMCARARVCAASTKGARQYSFKTESSERVARRGAREGQRGKQKQVRASNSGRPCCRLPTAFLQHNAPRATHTSGTIHGHTCSRARARAHSCERATRIMSDCEASPPLGAAITTARTDE